MRAINQLRISYSHKRVFLYPLCLNNFGIKNLRTRKANLISEEYETDISLRYGSTMKLVPTEHNFQEYQTNRYGY